MNVFTFFHGASRCTRLKATLMIADHSSVYFKPNKNIRLLTFFFRVWFKTIYDNFMRGCFIQFQVYTFVFKLYRLSKAGGPWLGNIFG